MAEFKDPIASTRKDRNIKNPWDFSTPCYDDRNHLSLGQDHGVGFANPVGSMQHQTRDDVIPKGRIETLSLKRDPSKLKVESNK